jgi:hypothetical protein
MKIDTSTCMKKRCPSNISRIALLAGSLPFVAYGLSILKYAVNIPYRDDFYAALSFTNSFIHAGTAEERVKLIFSQHNEHRIVLDRLIFLGNYYVLHGINFRYCIILGNLGWVLTVVMLTLIFHRIFRLSPLQLLPIPFCLLTFNAGNMFYAMASLQNYWFILFSVAFLYCLSRFEFFGLSALFPAAFFTSGGGVVLYLLGNLFLAARKRWKLAWTLFGLSTICIFVYFHNYIQPRHSPKLSEAVLHPFRTMTYLFVYLGNIWWPTKLGIFTVVALSSATGLTICVLSIYIIFRRRSDDFLRLTLGFVMLIAITAAFTRSSLGLGQALAGRYCMYPLLALTCIYVYVSTSERLAAHTTVWVAIALCAVVYWATTSAVNGKHFSDERDNRIASIQAFRNGDKDKLRELFLGGTEQAANILFTAERQRIYDYRHYEP